jgi:DNA/RNA-binding domain of Phe-tRNA-synthetase-like protein
MSVQFAPRFANLQFVVAPNVAAKGIRVVVFALQGLQNKDSDAGFEKLQEASLREIVAHKAERPLSADPILQGFRNLHTSLGFSNRNFPAASESLLEYVYKNARLPHINLLVDIYNLVSVETRLALGAHDVDFISGNVQLRITDGAEGFRPLGSPANKPVRPGAYAYCDDDRDVICLMEVKQVEKTKATLETHDVFYIVQGNAQTSLDLLLAGAERTLALTQQYCGGEVRWLHRGG